MKAWTGAVIAILMMGLVFGLGLRSLPDAAAARTAASAVPATATGAPAQAVPIVYSQVPVVAQGAAASESVGGQAPVLVSCGAGQQTLVRQIWLNGQPTSQVECVGTAAATRGVVYPSAQVRTVSDEEVVYDRVVVQEPRVVRTAQAPVYRQTEGVSKPRRSWQKTALIIGGSTAAGAGVGGIVGGKKGALIGAAIGGGGSTLFEALRRR
jgi:hypothetical protein